MSKIHIEEATGIPNEDYYIFMKERGWAVECNWEWKRFGFGITTNWSDPGYTTVLLVVIAFFRFEITRWDRPFYGSDA